VKVSLAPSTLFRTASDPFTKSKASDLLGELKSYRSQSSAQKALGVTHLMTGRDLDTDTVGIAYIGSVCDSANADSLSQSSSATSTTQSALIAAHEIGHNFNAPHDGESGACASTPQTFLMAPRLNGSDQFSACSIEQIQPILNNAQCLTAYAPPDAGIEVANTAVTATVGTAFVASFVVRSTGDDASTDVVATATVPAGLTVNTVTANGGTCSSGAGTASCTLGTLPAGDTRQIDFNLTATQTGALPLALVLDSTNDPNASNDTGTITVTASDTSPSPPSGGGTTSPATGGGGGGGRVDFALLTMLGLALLAAHRRAINSRALAMLRRRPRVD
jgi:MYXO-CTERM domain-containing protein